MGERGDDLEIVKKHEIPKIVEEKDVFSVRRHLAIVPYDFLVDAVQRYNVDESRVYLTGLSIEGYRTWHLAAAYR